MAEYEHAYKAICESCGKTINKNITVFTVANMDNISSISDNLIKDKLNRVTCTHCGKSFIYELPFIAYSFKKGYSILALPSCDENSLITGKRAIFDMFRIKMTKFRLVNFLFELVEKIRIFESELNDYVIEEIKLNNFDEKYFYDKRENILVFKEIRENNLIFEYCDFLGNVSETHQLPMYVYNDNQKYKDVPYTKSNNIKWQKVDINTIKESSNA